MKISELQKSLDSFKKEYGDLDVFVPDSWEGFFPNVLKVQNVGVWETKDDYIHIDVCELERIKL